MCSAGTQSSWMCNTGARKSFHLYLKSGARGKTEKILTSRCRSFIGVIYVSLMTTNTFFKHWIDAIGWAIAMISNKFQRLCFFSTVNASAQPIKRVWGRIASWQIAGGSEPLIKVSFHVREVQITHFIITHFTSQNLTCAGIFTQVKAQRKNIIKWKLAYSGLAFGEVNKCEFLPTFTNMVCLCSLANSAITSFICEHCGAHGAWKWTTVRDLIRQE